MACGRPSLPLCPLGRVVDTRPLSQWTHTATYTHAHRDLQRGEWTTLRLKRNCSLFSPSSHFSAASPAPEKKENMKLNVCVHFIMSAIAFWKLQVAECLTFSCQASSCWDNKCLSSFAHSGGCRLQTAGARRSLNTIPIRTPVLVPPLWLASPHARNLLLSNIYTQLEWQMYRNFTHTLPPHLESVCIFLCVFVFWETGCVFLTSRGEGGLNYSTNRVKFPLRLFIQEFQEEIGVDDCYWVFIPLFYCGSLGERQSLCFTFLRWGWRVKCRFTV